MEVCRACLATETSMLPIDEAFVTAYNHLTSLSVALLDALPQYVCSNCYQTVKFYIEFRDNCITTETSLRDVIIQKLKYEDDDKPLSETKDFIIKQEIKEEEDNGSDSRDSFFNKDVFCVKKDLKKETKPKKRKYKKRKYKSYEEETLVTLQPDPSLSCGLCKENFTERTKLSEHIEKHKDENSTTCGLCSALFRSWPELVAHRFSHIPKKEYRCHVCNKSLWAGAINMEYHYMNEHFDGEKSLRCKHCSRAYKNPKRLRKHMYHAHSKNCYICDHCRKTFNSRAGIKLHLRYHSDKKAYVCDECGFSCKYSNGLKDHKNRKHSPAKVVCKNCMRVFANAADHDKHTCKTGSRVCPVCGVEIPFVKNYNRHMKLHSTEKPHKCSRCPAAYKTKGALIAHNNRHDGVRPLQCPFCPMKFFTASVLIKHKRIHTGEKPYVCKVCHKGFTGNNNLKVHMKVHGEYLVVKRNQPDDVPLYQLPPPGTTNLEKDDDRSIDLTI